MIKKLFLLILIIFIVLHYLKYKKISSVPKIIQINDKLYDYKEYLDENQPIIFYNQNINDIKDYIKSPLSINEKILNLNISNYVFHSKDLFILYSNENLIKINLLSPNEKKNFIKDKNSNTIINNLKIINNNFNFSEIILKPNTLLLIPRFWIFSLENKNKIDLFYSDSIFSYIFSKFV